MLDEVARRAKAAGVFGPVKVEPGRVVCAAKASAEPAHYRVEARADGVWVSLVMKDRWLSESIETDLVHTGDKLDELIEDELADLGWTGAALSFEHFRSEDLLFTFQSRVPGARSGTPASAAEVATCLLAYEQCFRQLGDMEVDDEDE